MKGDNKEEGGVGKFFQEAAEHTALHLVGHAVAGAAGSLAAGLLHMGTLNEGEDQRLREMENPEIARLIAESQTGSNSMSPSKD